MTPGVPAQLRVGDCFAWNDGSVRITSVDDGLVRFLHTGAGGQITKRALPVSTFLKISPGPLLHRYEAEAEKKINRRRIFTLGAAATWLLYEIANTLARKPEPLRIEAPLQEDADK